MKGSYEELSPAMQEQVNAAIDNIRNKVWPGMEQYQEDSLREHIANVVATCLFIEHMAEAEEALAFEEPPCW